MHALFHPSWLQLLLIALATCQVTILCVTVYLHRTQAHRALEINPVLAPVIRAWLWLLTSMSTLQWVAVHRKHHAHCETVQDPHSLKHFGLARVLFRGVRLYSAEAKNSQTLGRYGRGAPNDWLEHKVYIAHANLGLGLTTVFNIALFGPVMGLTLSAVQFLWIPFWAAGVINGLAHSRGYRSFTTPDESRNLIPWGIWIGGEELHNNHHAHATSAKLSYHWWEVDIGWGAIQVLQALGLAKVKKQTRPPALSEAPSQCTPALVQMLAQHQMLVSRWFQSAWANTLRDLRNSRALTRVQAKALRGMWHQDHPDAALHKLVGAHADLSVMRSQWAHLQAMWVSRRATTDEVAQSLADWCEHAEQSGIRALSAFSVQLRRVQV